MKKKISILILAILFSATFFSYSLAYDLPLPENTGLPSQTIYFIIKGILLWLLGILGIFGIIGFVISGIMYLVSAGSDETIKTAKKYMTASIIGIVVGLAGFIAVQAIDRVLNATPGF